MHLIRRAAFRAATALPAASSRSLSTRMTSSRFQAQAIAQPLKLSAVTFRRFTSDSATENDKAAEVEPVEEAKDDSFNPTEPAYTFSRESQPTLSPARGARPEVPPNSAIYVGNLQFDVTDVDLKHEFEQFGVVKRTVLATDPRGLSKGFGYVEFDTVEEATAAIQGRNQAVYCGRRMIVNYQTNSGTRAARNPNPPSKTLFIGNLAFEMSDADLNKLFRDIRNVIDVRVAIDRRTGQPRGFAHADFTDIESAEKAKSILHAKEVYGRALRVDFSASKTPRLGGFSEDRPQSSGDSGSDNRHGSF